MIPWMWKSGMTVKERSAAVSCNDAAMLRAERARLRWRSGTIFGRDVVPDVWSTSASSSAGRSLDPERVTPVVARTVRSADRPSPRTSTAIVPPGAAASAAGA